MQTNSLTVVLQESQRMGAWTQHSRICPVKFRSFISIWITSWNGSWRNSAHISDRSKTFSYSWCSTLRTCLIFNTGFIIKEIEAKLKILFLGLLFSQLLLPFNFDTAVHFDKRKWCVRNKAGRKETEWEVLFSADFTSAEVYNKVSADHSLLKALTNNTPAHGKWIKPVLPRMAAGEHCGMLWSLNSWSLLSSAAQFLSALHHFFLLLAVEHI